MIKFIVCDDNSAMLESNCCIVNRLMMENNYDYSIDKFADYNEDFKAAIDSPGSKIYILDIELPTKSGIDIAREIRETDTDSIIIISSVYESLSNRIFKNKLMILAFISKFDHHDEELEAMIRVALDHFGKKKLLKFEINSVEHFVRPKDVLYITTDTTNRKVVIQTYEDKFDICGTLNDIESSLGKNFLRSHKSCIVNMENVKAVNLKEGTIIFRNNKEIDLLSRTYKKSIREWTIV